MNAVWSFWTRPHVAHHGSAWLSEKHHLLSWVLSFQTARRHYARTVLVTDDLGVRVLCDRIGLAFDRIHTDLNELAGADPEWWVLGKLAAYRIQTEPFIHLDADVFLWNQLPETLATAPVCTQNPERFPWGDKTWYRPQFYDAAVRAAGGWLPDEWSWYIRRRGTTAYCCGILGGSDTAFLQHYAATAVRVIQDARNAAAWAQVGRKVGDNILVEQYLLAACVAYHRGRAHSPHQRVRMRCLFENPDEPFIEQKAREAGFTHLIGGAKRNREIAGRLEERVRREFPAAYARCCAAAEWVAKELVAKEL